MPELTITSPYVHSRVDSNTFTIGNPMPGSTLSSSQGLWIWPQNHDLPPPLFCVLYLSSFLFIFIYPFSLPSPTPPPPHPQVVFPYVLKRKKIPLNIKDMCTYILFTHIKCPLNQRENIWPHFWIIKMTALTHIHFSSWAISLTTGTEADATLFCVCRSVLINFKGTAA
jgi:hypothetical protein